MKTPINPISRQSKDSHLKHSGTFNEIFFNISVPKQQPFCGGTFIGFRKLQENKPKTTEPKPVPVRTTPLTYIFLPGKYLLHSTKGTIKFKPEQSPNMTPQRTIKVPMVVAQLLTKMKSAWAITTKAMRINGWVHWARNRPNRIVRPMQSIMTGKAIALLSNVTLESMVRQQEVMQMLIMPHWYKEPIIKWMNIPPKHPINPMTNRLLHNPYSLSFMNSQIILNLLIILLHQIASQMQQVKQDCNVNQSLAEKQALKEEAKQTLLKQCYKMASNKYLRLISMGPEGFSNREWSVIHLNTAISLQFQNKMPEALEKVNEAIRIDPTYEKAYYRRLQILDDMGEQQLILHDNIIPAFITNQQLNKLRQEIVEKYRQTVGLSKLKSKLQDQQFLSNLGPPSKVNKFVDDSYRSIFSRIMEEVGRQTGQGNFQISRQMAEHYQFLKLMQAGRTEIEQAQKRIWLTLFCTQVHKLCFKYILSSSGAEAAMAYGLFSHFWKDYSKLFVSTLGEEQILINLGRPLQFELSQKEQEEGDGEALLLILYPAAIVDFPFFVHVIKSFIKTDLTQSNERVNNLIKFIHANYVIFEQLEAQKQLLLFNNEDVNQFHEIINQMIDKHLRKSYCIRDLSPGLEVIIDKLMTFERTIIAISKNSTQAHTKPMCSQVDSIFVQLYRIKQKIETNVTEKYIQKGLQSIKKCIKSKHNQMGPTFGELYLCYLIINKICTGQHRSSKVYEQGKADMEDLLFKMWLTQSQKRKFQNTTIEADIVGKCLVIASILGYINPIFIIKVMENKRSLGKNSPTPPTVDLFNSLCNLDQILQLFQVNIGQSVRILGVYAEVLASLAVSDLSFLSLVLASPPSLRRLYGELCRVDAEKKENYHLNGSVKLLYALVVDVKMQQEKVYAKKLGVSEEEVRKARQLQGEVRDSELTVQIGRRRQKLIEQLTRKKMVEKQRGWASILTSIISSFGQGQIWASHKSTEIWMLVCVILELAQKQSTQFYASVFVNFMLNCFKRNRQQSKQMGEMETRECYSVGRYFSVICKNCNGNIFSYTQLQSIVNCVVFLIQQANHELHIFEGLLSLINLSCKNIQVPLKMVQTCLMEQNQYIVHASLEFLNNFIVNSEFNSKTHLAQLQKLEEITSKYYKYYQTLLKEEMESKKVNHNVAITNYSHPYKIFCTLLSVLQLFGAIAEAQETTTSPKNPNIEELHDWKTAHKVLLHMSNHGGEVCIPMFKLVLHHAEKRTLPAGWSKGLEKLVGALQVQDREKYAKIQKYLS